MTERTFVSMAATGLLHEFKSHIRMTSSDLDAELNAKLLAAVRHAEHHIGKVILRSEFVTTVPFASSITLKVPDIVVLGLEVDGVAVQGWSLDGRTLYVPSTVTGTTMSVTYEAGYECIPWDMKAAILMLADVNPVLHRPAPSCGKVGAGSGTPWQASPRCPSGC